MNIDCIISRRRFIESTLTVAGYLALGAPSPLWAKPSPSVTAALPTHSLEDRVIRLSFNENPYGPTPSVLKAMADAFHYSNRYEYEDCGLIQALATHHKVKPENILLGAGSTEILNIIDTTFLQNQKKVIGVEPTFATVYEWARGMKCEAIRLPLLPNYHQDIPALTAAAKQHHESAGFLYLCNPNNPTGIIVPQQEIRQLLNEIPQDMPVVIDEAYHHYIEDPDYATSIPYVLENRPVIIVRTFSKFFGLAGMRLGYCVAPKTLIDQMRPHSSLLSVNAIVKRAGIEALKDIAGQEKIKQEMIHLREKTMTDIQQLGYEVIPSQTNFFMIHIKRPVIPVIEQFYQHGILVGRPFPAMQNYMRVSIGTPVQMQRFMAAFKIIFNAR